MKPKKPWMHEEVLRGMYITQELTLREIAKILDTAPANILYWMKKFGIETRKFCIGDVQRGTHRTEEEKQRLSEIAKERFKKPEDHPMFGHKHSLVSRRKMSETKKRKRQERLGKSI